MKKMLSVLGLVLLSVAVALAADELFKKIDQDSDGKVSWQEYQNAVAAKFSAHDKNRDGILASEELKSVGKDRAGKLIKKIDANSDGKISKQEFLNRAAFQYKKIDKNQDGFIDINEWKAAQTSPRAPMFIIFTF